MQIIAEYKDVKQGCPSIREQVYIEIYVAKANFLRFKQRRWRNGAESPKKAQKHQPTSRLH